MARARAVQVKKMFTRKLTKNQAYLEILVPYLDNPFEEAVFENNQIKGQDETETTK